jgi:hypothetical protein
MPRPLVSGAASLLAPGADPLLVCAGLPRSPGAFQRTGESVQ